ncbi:hypothetical protein DFQ27_006570, partial [Actinomortierella ambigua]
AKVVAVSWKGNAPQPQTVTIIRGDTVRWTNNDKDAYHGVVETTGKSTCIEKSGGFRSGKIEPGQSWQRTFVEATTINYMDGVAGQCQRGGKGIIVVQYN